MTNTKIAEQKFSDLEQIAVLAQNDPCAKNDEKFENQLEEYLSNTYAGGKDYDRNYNGKYFDPVPLLLSSNEKIRTALESRIEVDLRGDFSDKSDHHGQKYTIIKYKSGGKTKLALTSVPNDREELITRYKNATGPKQEFTYTDLNHADYEHRDVGAIYAIEHGCCKMRNDRDSESLQDGEFVWLHGGWIANKNTDWLQAIGRVVSTRDASDLFKSTYHEIKEEKKKFVNYSIVNTFFEEGDGFCIHYTSGSLGCGNELAEAMLRFKGYRTLSLMYNDR